MSKVHEFNAGAMPRLLPKAVPPFAVETPEEAQAREDEQEAEPRPEPAPRLRRKRLDRGTLMRLIERIEVL